MDKAGNKQIEAGLPDDLKILVEKGMSLPSEEFADEIHQRLLDDDPIARSELAITYLKILVGRLQSNPRFSGVRDKEYFYDAAIDAILNYTENPSRFDSSKSKLLSYLTRSAEGDLLNALAKEKRRTRDEDRTVEQLTLNLNESLTDSKQAIYDDHPNQELMRRVFNEFTDLCDRQLLPLILDKERKTSAYAEILGIQGRDEVEQRRLVKQHKDRIKVRLRRLGVKVNG